MNRRVGWAVFALAILPACGGGGGSGGGTPPAWGAPLLMEGVAGTIPEFDLSSDAAGNLFLVWGQYDGIRTNLWSRRYVNGSGWTVAELVELNIGDTREPRLMTRPSGETWVVWRQRYNSSKEAIWASRALSPSGWTAPALVSAGDFDAGRPEAASDDAGNVWVVWDQIDLAAPLRTLWTARYTPAGGWQASALLSAGTGTGDYLPDVAAGSTTGAAVAVWQEYDGTHVNIRAARFTAGGGWSAPQTIDDRTNAGSDARVAMSAAGDALAVWSQSGSAGAADIVSARALAGGAWEAPVRVDDDFGNSEQPMIVMNAAGVAFVAWRDAIGPTSAWAARYTPATGWEAGLRVETEDVQGAWLSDVAINSLGEAAVVWHQNAGGQALDVWAAFYRGAWSPAERVEFSGTTIDALPRVALDDAGRAAAAWSEPLIPGPLNLWTALYR